MSSSLGGILNVQDIIREITKETSLNISSTCIPSTIIAIHPILANDVPRTKDVCFPTKFRLDVGPASQPIAGSMPVNCLRRWLNTNPSLGLLYTLIKHVAFTQCCFKVDSQSSTLARDWNSIEWLYRGFGLLRYRGDVFHPGTRNTR